MSGTRRGLHAVAAYVLAGPQYAASGTIRLRVEGGAISTVAQPRLRLTGPVVVTADGTQAPIQGRTARALARDLGLEARSLHDVYPDQPELGLDDVLAVDPVDARRLLGQLAAGAAALERLAPNEVPVLWPEHFDVAISVGEVNYGVSPGDGAVPEPYAYVGPWTPPARDAFWNQPFGAARSMAELGDADGVLAFFHDSRSRLGA